MSLKKHLKRYIYQRGRVTLNELLAEAKRYKVTTKDSTTERTLRLIVKERPYNATRWIEVVRNEKGHIVEYETRTHLPEKIKEKPLTTLSAPYPEETGTIKLNF